MTLFSSLKPSRLSAFWRQWPYKGRTIVALVAAIILIIALIALRRPAEQTQNVGEQLPQVTVSQVSELQGRTYITETGLIESNSSAPLVARNGGRVTAINVNLGDTVAAGRTVVSIDSAGTGNPIRAQVTGIESTLAALASVKDNALKAADAAIAVTQIQLDSAVANRPLSQEQAAIARRNADIAAESARLALLDAQDISNDTAIRNADLAAQQAGLAQDTATVGLQQANLQTANAVSLAQANLANSQVARQRIVAEMDSQITQVNTQLAVAQAQLQQQQVTTPISGRINRLTVKVGDYLNPGQEVGEVMGNNSGRVTLTVTSSVRGSLAVGQTVSITGSHTEFTGTISHISSMPSSQTGLFQIDISVTNLPEGVSPNSTVEIQLPVTRETDRIYIPLDALNVRTDGPVIFILDNNKVRSLPINIQSYDGDYVAIQAEGLSLDDQIVIKGNRTLRDDTEVSVTK